MVLIVESAKRGGQKVAFGEGTITDWESLASAGSIPLPTHLAQQMHWKLKRCQSSLPCHSHAHTHYDAERKKLWE